MHRVKFVKFNPEAWLKLSIDMNTKLRKKAKVNSKKIFFKFMKNVAFEKIMENLRKQRDINLVTTEARMSYLASEPNYHAIKYFSENLLVMEMKKQTIKQTK